MAEWTAPMHDVAVFGGGAAGRAGAVGAAQAGARTALTRSAVDRSRAIPYFESPSRAGDEARNRDPYIGKVRVLFCIRKGVKTGSTRVLTPNFHGDPTLTTRGSTLSTPPSTLVTNHRNPHEGCRVQ